jgi:protein disulfide-isomerase A1
MDTTVNEVDGLRVSSYPTLKFYPSNNKEGVDHEGGRTVEDLLAWL